MGKYLAKTVTMLSLLMSTCGLGFLPAVAMFTSILLSFFLAEDTYHKAETIDGQDTSVKIMDTCEKVSSVLVNFCT